MGIIRRLLDFKVRSNIKSIIRILHQTPINNLENLHQSYVVIFIVAIISIFFNFYSSQANDNEMSKNMVFLENDLNNLTKTIESVTPYTPTIDEDLGFFRSELALQNSTGYLNKNESIITEASKLETEYIIQKGDTISQIANKFNMHVATILDRNSIKVENIEKLSPGQKIIIPPKDSSDSQDWLVQLNQKKEAERQLALKKQQENNKKLALSKTSRNVSTRERASSGFGGEDTGGWIQPISYKYISRGIQRGHTGIDMVANIGTAVYASKSGRVIEQTRGWGSGYGFSILMDHGGGQTSRYGHLSEFTVGVGDSVSQGQLIGYSGNTGWSTGPHLHFEARLNGRSFNPWR